MRLSTPGIANWAAIFGIPSLIVTTLGFFTASPWLKWFGAVAFVFCLLAVPTILFIHVYKSVMGKFPEGTDVISHLFSYRNDGGDTGIFEAHKFVQIKRAWMTTIKEKFNWYGSQELKISSKLQQVEHTERKQSLEPSYSYLRLKAPKVFNECVVLHWEATLDVSHPQTPHFIGITVKEPMDVIELKAVLGRSGEARKNAIISCRPIEHVGQHGDFRAIEEVPFDSKTASYSWRKHHPEPGFQYKMDYLSVR